MNGKIYVLLDENDKIRYVGQTTYPIYLRLSNHIKGVKYEKTYKSNWIKSMLKRGLKPKIKLVEDCIEDKYNLNVAEIFYIKEFKKLGCMLVNTHSGGNGGNLGFMKKGMFFGKRLEKGYKQSEDTINKKVLNNPLRTMVDCFDIDGNFIKTYISQGSAAIELKLSQGNINGVLNGSRKTTGGYIFKYSTR